MALALTLHVSWELERVASSRWTANQAAAQLLTEVTQNLASSTTGSAGYLLNAPVNHARAQALAPKTIVGYELLAKQAKADFGTIELPKLTAARLDRYCRGLLQRDCRRSRRLFLG